MSSTSPSSEDGYNLNYLINHIFFPPRLPQADDASASNDSDICRVVLEAAQAYERHVPTDAKSVWVHIIAMLDRFCTLYNGHCDYMKDDLAGCISQMRNGDSTALLVRKQNAGLIIRQLEDRTVFESFEASALSETVMSNVGKLMCSFPGPAIAVPSDRARDHRFISELSNFLAQMNGALMTNDVTKAQDAAHPRFITELLTGILRGIGEPEDEERLVKRVADDVLSHNSSTPWRRSPLWLVIRVALQTTLRNLANRCHVIYKTFLAFLMTQILRRAVKADLDSDLLSVMHKKLARRIYKIGNDAPSFLMDEVTGVGESVQSLLQKRWDAANKRDADAGLTGWDPSRLRRFEDTTLSLSNSKAYISGILQGKHDVRSPVRFEPSECQRLKRQDDFTADSFANNIQTLGSLVLLDFERAVEQGIDIWVKERLTSEVACSTIWRWIEEYYKHAEPRYKDNPEEMSVMYLTLLDLWIGLDKLCTKQCPLLLDYSPEIAEEIFKPLLLRRSESIERLRKAVLYLRDRHSRAVHRDAIFCKDISSSNFAVRFFDQSQQLQTLKQKIELQAHRDREKKVAELEKENSRYHDLVRQEKWLSHDYYVSSWDGKEYHDTKCKKH